MTFQIKDFRSIAASMINVSRANGSKITDFSVGSVARTLMEASAVEIEELYLQILLGLQEAIPVSVFNSFNFAAMPAIAASGTVRFSCDVSGNRVEIPLVTTIKSDSSGFEYATASFVAIEAGSSYADVQVACTQAGSSTNCAANTLTTMVASISGITSVTNPLPLANGADAETDASRKSRFTAYISTLSRGTGAALRYGASQSAVVDSVGSIVEQARHIAIIEPYLTDAAQPIGLVNLYVHNGSGNTSATLVAKVQSDVDGTGTTPGWKAAGVVVDVYAAQDYLVNVTGSITLDSGTASVSVTASDAIKSYIQSLGIGQKVVRSELISIIMAISGVYNVSLSSPAADVVVSAIQKAMPGTVAL